MCSPMFRVQVASRSVGLFGSSSDSDSSESGTENDDQDENDVVEIPSAELGQILMSSGFNWFSVVETAEHYIERKMTSCKSEFVVDWYIPLSTYGYQVTVVNIYSHFGGVNHAGHDYRG